MLTIEHTTVGVDAIIGGTFRNATGESPVWSASEQALYWVDIRLCRIHRYAPSTNEINSWSLPEMVGCIALRRGGGLIAACETGVFSVDLSGQDSALVTLLAPIKHSAPNMRCNDGRCDRQGRFWTSTMIADSTLGQRKGALYRYTSNGLHAFCMDSFIVPNGIAFSPNGNTMYVSDSHTCVRKIWAFDYDTAKGEPSNQRLFVDLNQHVGRPDGATVDAEGCYWTCAMDSGRVMRFTPDGKLDRTIEVPMKKPTMGAFGGKNMDTLFITSLCRSDEDRETDPLAGCLVATRPGVTGMGEVLFG